MGTKDTGKTIEKLVTGVRKSIESLKISDKEIGNYFNTKRAELMRDKDYEKCTIYNIHKRDRTYQNYAEYASDSLKKSDELSSSPEKESELKYAKLFALLELEAILEDKANQPYSIEEEEMNEEGTVIVKVCQNLRTTNPTPIDPQVRLSQFIQHEYKYRPLLDLDVDLDLDLHLPELSFCQKILNFILECLGYKIDTKSQISIKYKEAIDLIPQSNQHKHGIFSSVQNTNSQQEDGNVTNQSNLERK